jgi:hypothetical protein
MALWPSSHFQAFEFPVRIAVAGPVLGEIRPVTSVSLVADLDVYPDYKGVLKPSGKMIVRFNRDHTFLLKLDAKGLEPGCTGCAVQVLSGTSCDDAALVGNGLWNTEVYGTYIDPWIDFGVYKTDDEGKVNHAFVGDSGLGYESNLGRAAVLAASVSTGCNVLVEKEVIR